MLKLCWQSWIFCIVDCVNNSYSCCNASLFLVKQVIVLSCYLVAQCCDIGIWYGKIINKKLYIVMPCRVVTHGNLKKCKIIVEMKNFCLRVQVLHHWGTAVFIGRKEICVIWPLKYIHVVILSHFSFLNK